jgi:tripartite-type tricarboxylate transporter receptor subunit TctC
MRAFDTTLIAAAGLSIFFSIASANAQEFPSEKSITLVVNVEPGSPVDFVGRTMKDDMAAALGQQVIVENRSGFGGVTGSGYVARAKPDGYTILMSGAGPMINSPLLFSNVPYDPVKDFERINLSTSLPAVIAVSAAVPATDLKEFIAYVKASPGKYTFGSSGIGSPAHLVAEMLKLQAGIDMRHVPYKGAAQAAVALTSNEIMMNSGSTNTLLPLYDAGKIKILAHTGIEPIEAAPKIPSTAQLGYPKVNAPIWFGYFAPKGTPKKIIDAIDAAAMKALANPQVVASFKKAGISVVGLRADEFDASFKKEVSEWKTVFDSIGLKPGLGNE